MSPGAGTTARAREVSRAPAGIRLVVLLATVFVDLVGFGIVLPLLPLYADRFGASGTWIGILVLSYSAAQLLLAPMWGRLSDRFGRRPILILGLLGSAVSYVIFAYAGSIAVLLLSRIMAGIGGANIPVAQAYVADVTPPESRAASMGMIGAAFGLGFIFGPAIGGVLAPIAPELPGLAAAGLCAANALLAVLFLPESLPRAERRGRAGEKVPVAAPSLAMPEGAMPIGLPVSEAEVLVDLGPAPTTSSSLRAVLDAPDFRRALVVSFLITAAFSAMHPTFSLFAARRFALDETAVGWVFAFMGAMSAITQGVLVRFLVSRTGEVVLIRASTVPFVVGFVLIALAPTLPLLLTGLAVLALGFGSTLPSLTSLLSRSAPAGLQGGSLGVAQSAAALARIVGPLVAGIAWDLLGIQWPYFLAAMIGVAAGAWSLALRQPPPAISHASLGASEASSRASVR